MPRATATTVTAGGSVSLISARQQEVRLRALGSATDQLLPAGTRIGACTKFNVVRVTCKSARHQFVNASSMLASECRQSLEGTGGELSPSSRSDT
jgi:hypothetical protein